LAAQFWSTSIESNAHQRGDSDRVCADLQPLLDVEQAFLFVRISVRAGSLPAYLGAVRDDRDLSLLVYVLVLYWSLAYLRNRRLWQLAVVQALSVLLISFRMSFLPVVQACTILLPLIAFARCGLPASRKRLGARALEAGVLTKGLTHVVPSIAMMFVMHGAYKYANGWLSNREPAYLYDAGEHLAAVWAPALEPSDATDSRFRDLIAKGHQFKIDDLTLEKFPALRRRFSD